MEHIRLSQPEHDKENEDDPYRILIRQQEKKRDAAVKIIEEQTVIANTAQDVIDGFRSESAVPTIVMEVATIVYEHDVYYSSERDVDMKQYSIRSDSLTDAVSRLANHLNPTGARSTNKPAYRLNVLGIAFGAASYQDLDSDDIFDYKKLFQQRMYRRGEES